MRYHLKEDGSPGVCTAEPGKCPKGDAIHGESIQDVYAQLEEVMAEQLFKNKEPLFPAPKPRPSAREIGSAGILIRSRQPFVVKQQLEGLRELGIIEQAIPTLEAHQPLLVGAVKTNREDAVLWDELYERPEDYTYEGSRGEYFIGQTDTWVADASYEIQTIALNHLMDTLENGELEGTDLKALGKALGNINVPEDYPDKIGRNGNTQREDSFSFDYMAFNYNPERQDDDFFNGLKNRLAAEGFDKKKVGDNKHEVTVPAFLWKGLDNEAKERFAAQVLYKDTGTSWQKTFKDRIFHRSNFNEIISRTFAPSRSNGTMIRDGKLATIGLDHNGSTVSGVMNLTENGFRWTEQERHYVEPPKDPFDRW